MPKVSLVRSSSASTAWSPRRMLPAREERVSASAVAFAARRDSRRERSTMVGDGDGDDGEDGERQDVVGLVRW